MKKLITILCFALLFSSCVSNKGPSDLSDLRELDDMIVVNQPQANAEVGCPLHIEGMARGYWYFEGSFPVKLVDSNGDTLTQNLAVANGEWMIDEFVPFILDLPYEISAADAETGANAILILEKDNPSGMPANDSQLQIPVVLGVCEGAPE